MAETIPAAPGAFHPSRTLYRFSILIFVALLSFGSYFAYDIIGAIAPSLIVELKAARATVGTMNTMYSIAAILVVLFGGILIDKLGTRKASLLFSVLVFVGAVIVWQAKSIPVIFLGRFIFGAGSEPLVVAQSAILARWFKNKELALSFGLTLTVSRLGSLFAFNTGELFTSYFKTYRAALFVAAAACLISLLGNLVYIFMDRRAERIIDLKDENVGEKLRFRGFFFGRLNRLRFFLYWIFAGSAFLVLRFSLYTLIGLISNPSGSSQQIAIFSYLLFLLFEIVVSAFLIIRRLHDLGKTGANWLLMFIPFYNLYFLFSLLFEKGTQGPNQYGSDPLLQEKVYKPSFWYVTFLCFTFYAAIFPFQSLSTDFFATKWGIALTAKAGGSFLAQVFNNLLHIFSTAGGITSIIIFASMLLAPFAGRLVDRVGRRATFMIAGSLLLIPCHLAMGLTRVYPVYPMILLGFAFVLVPAAMWPSVPLIVRSERVGTAFGLMTAIQNIGLGLFPLLNGLLRDATGTYVASQVMFASLGVVGLVFALLLKRADAREGGGLEAAAKKSA